MGQQISSSPVIKGSQSFKKQSKAKNFIVFERDPRLVQQYINIPQLFAGLIDSDVKKVQRLIQAIPPHTLYQHIIDGLNERFFKITNIKQTSNIERGKFTQPQKKKNTPTKNQTNKKSQKFQQQNTQYYYELQNMQRFMQLLKKLQHWYYIQKQLDNAVRIVRHTHSKKITIRKNIIPNYQSKLDKHLFSKLFLHYYLVLLKKNFASKEKTIKNFMINFHQSIGKMLCQMIEYNHLTQKKLIQLTYKIVYVQKISQKNKLIEILTEIRQEFKPIYLTKQHSLVLKPDQYNNIRQVARCYLDQLYLRCLKEAQDPDIIVDQNQGFGLVKNFPIVRVRDQKNR